MFTLSKTPVSFLRNFFALMLFSVLAVPSDALAKDSAKIAHDIACKLTFILSPAALEFLSETDALPEKDQLLGNKIRSYIASNAYASLKPSTGRDELSAAFETAKRVQTAFDGGNHFEAGRIMAEGMMQISRACRFYKMSECIAFADQPSFEANTYFVAMNKLKECGAKLWASPGKK